MPRWMMVPLSGVRIWARHLSSVDLPGAVLADDAERLALLDLERHVLRAPRTPRSAARRPRSAAAFRYWFRSW